MADADGLGEWQAEEIPDTDDLYLRVHRNHLLDGELDFAAFRDQEPPPGVVGKKGMSTHWSKYADPDWIVQNRARSPKDTGIVRLNVGEVRRIPRLSVEHTPRPDDRSHTDVYGPKDTQSRLLLMRASRWVMRVPPKN